MNFKKAADVIGTIILAVGMLIAFSSHAFHARIGLDGEASHLTHEIYGMIAVVIGLGTLIYNNRALDTKNIKTFIMRK